MKNYKILTLAVLFLAACSDENSEMTPNASSGSTSTVSAKEARQFSATLSAAADPNSPPTACTGDIPGFPAPDFLLSGNAIHLGLMDVTSRLHHDACSISFTTGLLTTNVTVDLVAANGDVIHCSGFDTVNLAAYLGGTGTTGSITGTWTINGGTGRFSDATGTLTIDGTVDFLTNSFTCECVGNISY